MVSLHNEPLIHRSGLWEKQYFSHPYLRILSQSELEERYAYLNTNLLTLEENGQVGFELFNSTQKFCWIELISHVLTELKFRNPNAKDVEELNLRENFLAELCNPPKPTYPNRPKVVSAYQGPLHSENMIFKFGEKQFLE